MRVIPPVLDPTRTGASPALPDEWLTADEVAAMFKIPRKTVYAYRKEGRVRGHYPFGGKHLRFRRSELPGFGA